MPSLQYLDCSENALREPKVGDLVWVDPLTQTHCVLGAADAQTDLPRLTQMPVTELYHLVCEAKEPFHLPEQAAPWRPGLTNLPTAARLADRALLRTAIFAALLDGATRPDWPTLRKQALLWGLDQWPNPPGALPADFPAELGELLRAADAAAQGEPHSLLQQQQICLVKGGAVKVKQYLLETRSLKAVRGASLLLDEINLERVAKLFADPPYTPEMLIYSGGGHFLAILPDGRGPAMATQVERLYETVTASAQTAVASLRIPASRLTDQFQSARCDLDAAVQERQMSRLPPPIDGYPDPDINHLAPERPYKTKHEEVRAGDQCGYCGIRPPRWRVATSEEGDVNLCQSCTHKYSAGTDGHTRFFDDYRKQAKKLEMEPPQTLETLAGSRGQIALFYADGNNMSQKIGRLRSLAALRLFSQRVEATVTRVTYEALADQGQSAVEFIALGGDDLLLITPAEGALSLAIAIGRTFDAAFQCKTPTASPAQDGMTISIGVLIAPYHTPLRQLFDRVQRDLLASAKQRARQITGRPPTGTVDIAALTAAQALRSPTTAQPDQDQSLRLTLRPFTWDEADAFHELMQAAASEHRWSRSARYALREAITRLSAEEAILYYQYQLARRASKDDPALEQAITKLADLLQATVDGPFFQTPQQRVTPWVDLVELIDVLRPATGKEANDEAQRAD